MSGYMATAKRTNHGTPRDFYRALNEVYHFTLDVAATKKNKMAPDYIGRRQNALKPSTHWTGRVFVNPPYGKGLERWVGKAIVEVATNHAEFVVMLLPAYPDRKWFPALHVFSTRITFLTGRLHFRGAKDSAPFPSMYAVIQKKDGDTTRYSVRPVKMPV